MLLEVLRISINQLKVVECHLTGAEGLFVDTEILRQSGIQAGQIVTVANIDNGARFQIPVFSIDRGVHLRPGSTLPVVFHGGASHLVRPKQKISIWVTGYWLASSAAPSVPEAFVFHADDHNRITRKVE